MKMKVTKIHCPNCRVTQPLSRSYYRHNFKCKSCGYKENGEDIKKLMQASEHHEIDSENEISLNTKENNWSLIFNKSNKDTIKSTAILGTLFTLIPMAIIPLILAKEGLAITQSVVLGIPLLLGLSFLGLFILTIVAFMIFGQAQISVYKGLFEIFFGIGSFGIRQQIIWSRIQSASIVTKPKNDENKHVTRIGKQNQIRLLLENSEHPDFEFSTNFDDAADHFLVKFINEKITSQNNDL